MSRVVNLESAVTFIPSSYDTSNSSWGSSYYGGTDSGLTDTNSTTYATFRLYNTGYTGYYSFNVTGIPDGAVINSVSCSVKASMSSTGTQNAYYTYIQLCNGTTEKGSQSTVSSTTESIYNLSVGTWTLSELQNVKLRFKPSRASTRGTYSFKFYGAEFTVNYTINGTEYEVSFNNQSTDVTTDPSTTQYILGGGNQEIAFYGISSLDDVVIKDNNTDITNSLTLTSVGNSASASTVLGTYNLISGSFNSSSESYFQGIVGNGVNASQTTTNYYSSNSGVIVLFSYDLSFSNIPSNATITRLYCEVNGHAESTSNDNEYMCAQLILNTTATTISDELNFKSVGTSNTTQTIEATTLPTVAQLSGLKLACKLGYYGGSINGATCYLEYELPDGGQYYTYTLSNISADHTISIDDATGGTYYEVNASSTYTGATVSPSTQSIREGRNATVNIDVTNLYEIIVKDNGTDVTSSVTGTSGSYTYTVSNVQAAHTITVEEAPYSTISTTSSYAGATASANPTKVYNGQSTVITVSVQNLYEVKIKDGNTDITNSFTGSNGTYRYTLSNVQANHTISVEENTNYSVTVTSTYTGATGTATPSKVYEGQDSVVDIDVDNLYEIVLKDNGVDVTNSIVVVQGETSSPSFDIVEYVESASTYDSVYSTYYTSNGVAGSGSTTRACVYVAQTAYAEGKLTYKFDCSSIPANATITNVVCFAGAACYSNGQYFDTRTLQLYNGSTAKGTATTITGNGSTKTTHTVDGGSWTREELDDISIVARVVRGSSTSQASFSFWGATLSVSYTVPAGKTYTLTNVQDNHAITIEEAPYYTISTANTYTGATITAPSKIYAGQNGTVTLSVANLYEVVVTDNGTDITSSFNGSNGTYTYAIDNISGNHSISVSEAPYATVSVVSYYSSVTGSPASQKVYLGRNATITFTGSLTGLIIKDGETDVTSSVSQNSYTISNVQTSHTIYICREANFVKQDGTFKEIRTYYQKVNDAWTTITKVAFETIATANTMSYGGYFSGITSMGEVVEASKDITINDGELQSGTYKLYYEDENGTPLENYDEITEFTIS